jgi:hypothetical protein
MCRAYRRIQIRQHNELMSAAWHVAAFSRQTKLPALKDVLIDEDETGGPKRTKQQTAEQMLAVARMWNAALGGDEVELNG